VEDFITLAEVQEAQARIAGVVVRTSLQRLPNRPAEEPEIWIKDESEQPIRSFKLRGAYNKIAAIDEETIKRGVITYSSGNHAQGVAYAARARRTKAVIVMPNTSPAIKVEATKRLGGEIVTVGPASSERLAKAEELQREFGYTMVPPYDDRLIIAGAATCGLEIAEQMPEVDLVLVPVGGGGLLSGVAVATKAMIEGVRVFGVEPTLAADAKESFDTKTRVDWTSAQTTRTIADGLRTQGLGKLNFAHVMHFVDGILSVTEEEIYAAMRVLLQTTSMVPEPSGVVTLAAALYHRHELPPAKRIVVIMSGGNLDPALQQRLLQTDAERL